MIEFIDGVVQAFVNVWITYWWVILAAAAAGVLIGARQ